MYARVTRFRMKPESIDAALAKLDEMKPRILALPNMLQFIHMMNRDGNGYVIAVVASEEASNANQEAVMAIWSEFGEYLAEMPVPEGFNVIMNETIG